MKFISLIVNDKIVAQFPLSKGTIEQTIEEIDEMLRNNGIFGSGRKAEMIELIVTEEI